MSIDWAGSGGQPGELTGTPAAGTFEGSRNKATSALIGVLLDRTATPLGGGASFTGSTLSMALTAGSTTLQTAANYGSLSISRIGVAVFADQAGTIKYQGSADAGTTFDQFATTAVIASTPIQDSKAFLGYQQGRIVYTNGGVAQGAFRMGTMGAPLA